jgi:hypothetical protein
MDSLNHLAVSVLRVGRCSPTEYTHFTYMPYAGFASLAFMLIYCRFKSVSSLGHLMLIHSFYRLWWNVVGWEHDALLKLSHFNAALIRVYHISTNEVPETESRLYFLPRKCHFQPTTLAVPFLFYPNFEVREHFKILTYWMNVHCCRTFFVVCACL